MNENRAPGKVTEQSGIAAPMLELLCCPLSKGRLRWDPERRELVSDAARLAYPVRDGVPVMLPSEARQLDPDERKG
ncbi:MAG TPA: Trm112 family protein [Mesorhizobium sp.]|nr:Trm112 family protein [Mesorhizobium sp.]